MAGKPLSSEEQRKKYQQAFDLFDKDSSGKISFSELKTLLESIGQVVSDEELRDLGYSVNSDDDPRTFNLDEFIKLVESRVSGLNRSLIFALSDLDKNKDGFIDPDELLANVKIKLAGKMTDEKIKEVCGKMMTQADKDDDGKISYKEFAAML